MNHILQVAKDYDRARDAFEKAATGHSRQGSPWQSGKNLEKAAGLAFHITWHPFASQFSSLKTCCNAAHCLEELYANMSPRQKHALSNADMEKEWSKGQQSKRTRVEAMYRDAALSYQEAGRHQAAAEALGRAAVYLEGIEPEVDLCPAHAFRMSAAFL